MVYSFGGCKEEAKITAAAAGSLIWWGREQRPRAGVAADQQIADFLPLASRLQAKYLI